MADPKPTFLYLAAEIKRRHPNFAYLHAVEPRVVGTTFRDDNNIKPQEENDFLREVWAPKPFISAGHSKETAIKAADEKGDLVAFGRHFISNVRRCVLFVSEYFLNHSCYSLIWFGA